MDCLKMDCLKFTLAAAVALLLAACNEQSPPAASSEPTQQAGQASMPEQPAGPPVGAQPVANAAPPAARYEPPAGGRPIAANTSHQRVATRTPGTRAQIDVFYEGLNRHGSWVRHPDFSYVWLPRRGPGWRPYQEGRWIWTDDYGWFWESAEPFAWAVYHFGRWGYDPDLGWFWVPGDTWAPAWVAWRVGGGGIGWAPLAPDRKGFAFGPPRRFAPAVVEGWVFVEGRKFAEPDLADHVVPISEIGRYLVAASELRTPTYENGVVSNRIIRRDEVERVAERRIEIREVFYVGTQSDTFEDVRGARLGIYRPVIEGRELREPPRMLVDPARAERVIIREYSEARDNRSPSAVLLTILDRRERQELEDQRLTQQEAVVEGRIEQLRRERAKLLEERRREAERLQSEVQAERRDGIRQRMEEHKGELEARRQRASQITAVETALPPDAPKKPPVDAPKPSATNTPAPPAAAPIAPAISPAAPVQQAQPPGPAPGQRPSTSTALPTAPAQGAPAVPKQAPSTAAPSTANASPTPAQPKAPATSPAGLDPPAKPTGAVGNERPAAANAPVTPAKPSTMPATSPDAARSQQGPSPAAPPPQKSSTVDAPQHPTLAPTLAPTPGAPPAQHPAAADGTRAPTSGTNARAAQPPSPEAQMKKPGNSEPPKASQQKPLQAQKTLQPQKASEPQKTSEPQKLADPQKPTEPQKPAEPQKP